MQIVSYTIFICHGSFLVFAKNNRTTESFSRMKIITLFSLHHFVNMHAKWREAVLKHTV